MVYLDATAHILASVYFAVLAWESGVAGRRVACAGYCAGCLVMAALGARDAGL